MQQIALKTAAANGAATAMPRSNVNKVRKSRVAVVASANAIELDRRAVLASVAALISLKAFPAVARDSGRWDGESSALGSCALGDAGDECRKATLSKYQLESYSAAQNSSAKVGSSVTGVPVPTLDKQYVADTLALADKIEQYYTIDLEDPVRVQLVKELKKDGQTWVSKYARGGSARTVSARRFYIAVDAIGGHVASNGYAPYPRSKLAKVVDTIEESRKLLAQGK